LLKWDQKIVFALPAVDNFKQRIRLKEATMKNVKCVVVGDWAVGKASYADPDQLS
jgi:GTPase SAR1 family protein